MLNKFIDSSIKFTSYDFPLKDFFYSRQDTQFGFSTSAENSYLGGYGILRYFNNLFFGDYYFPYIIILLGLLSIVLFSIIFRKLLNKNIKGIILSYLLAFYFVFNLYTFSLFADSYGVLLLGYIFLPLEIIAYKYFDKGPIYILLYCLTWLLFPFSNLTIAIVTIIISLLIKYYILKDFNYKKIFYSFLLGGLFTCFLWIIYLYSLFNLSGSSLSEAKSETFIMTSRISSFVNVVSGIGPWAFGINWGINTPNYIYQDYFGGKMVLFIFKIIPIFAIGCLLFIKKRILLGFFIFLWIFSVGGNEGPLKDFFLNTNSSFLLIFRNTFKLYPIIQIIFIIAILNSSKLYKKIALIPFIMYLGVFAIYLIIPRQSLIESKIVQIPDNKINDIQILKERFLNKKLLLLPSQYFTVYEWGKTKDPVECNGTYSIIKYTAGEATNKNNSLYLGLINGDIKLEKIGISGVITIKDANYDIYSIMGGSYEESNSKFKKLCADNEIINLKTLDYCEINIKIDENNIVYDKKNPIKYNVKINNLENKQELKFFQSYHQKWKVYFKDKESLLSKSLFDFNHKEFFGFFNSWFISKDDIISYVNNNYLEELKTEGYPKLLDNGKKDYKYYLLNTDGSIDLELTIYFHTQFYFYLGLIISFTTFLLLIFYIAYNIIINKIKKYI